jgi:hypothetical protein
MEKGKLTPRSNNLVAAMRFSGGFGQPDGFASVLTVRINTAGELALTLCYRHDVGDRQEHMWSVTLTNEQRVELADFLSLYEPTLWEQFKE